jgi:hypothetical protein
MSRIFISHSSVNSAEALALFEWLQSTGWDDVFLDLDADRGLKAGEKCQAALKQAAERCELVVFAVSPEWAASKWCLAEFLLAQNLNKRIFGVIVKPIPLAELPAEMTSEWEIVDLTAEPRDHAINGPSPTIRRWTRNAPVGSGVPRVPVGRFPRRRSYEARVGNIRFEVNFNSSVVPRRVLWPEFS